MDVSRFVSPAALQLPDSALAPDPCVTHVPFAGWLIDSLRPGLVVELGQEPSGLFLAGCQAANRLGLSSRFMAVDLREEAPDRSANRGAQAHEHQRGHLCSLVQMSASEAAEQLPPGSVDLLHVAGSPACRALRRELPGWLEKMSGRGIILLFDIHHQMSDHEMREMIHGLRAGRRSIEFLHGGGLGVVGVGTDPPPSIAALFDAADEPDALAELRLWYHRLGQGVKDHLERRELDHAHQTMKAAFEGLSRGMAGHDLVREQNATLLEESRHAEERLAAFVQEAESLLNENRTLKQDLDRVEHARRVLLEEANRYQRSLTWALAQKARKFRSRLFRDHGRPGRLLSALDRFLTTSVRSGARVALRKTTLKVGRKLGVVRPKAGTAAERAVPRLSSGKVWNGSFEELNWTYTGRRPRPARGQAQRYPVLLISHSACKTGAPLCLLRLAKELTAFPELECWIILKRGGDLRPEFERVAPTLEAGQLLEEGLSELDVPELVAALFRDYASRGIAICNTMAVSEFHEALGEWDIPVLSWIHELPTMVELFGGMDAVSRIKAASRRIIVPADAVRTAWIDRLGVEPGRISRVHYGLDARTAGMDRASARARVRSELGIPDDAWIVLGCGTVDLRKGADLFAQVARKVLTDRSANDLAARTWFVWVGECPYFAFQDWLVHDAAVDGREPRLILTGQRLDTAPYFLAADVFALTSREDPCPFANLEAMESGLPVVAFRDAGGAPEVLGDAGTTVPYLDVDAMAAEVVKLLSDPGRRERLGRAAREIIREDFTWPKFMESFTELLRQSYGIFPPRELKVSVVVPNYRHAPYLEERLNSIYRQTRKPDEIIVLDDASPDDSVRVIERLAKQAPVPLRIAVNETNSGCPFRQWVKGIEMAAGDLIWIAESDDSCHAEFLERLLPEFHDPDVALAYCQSELIGPDGRQLEPHFLPHTDDLSKSRWRARYRASALVEAEQALSQKNTIPNASAMVFRKPRRLDFLDDLFRLRFAGDWLFHAMLAREGKVAYIPDVLNKYRRHERTVTHQATREDTHLTETLWVKTRICELFPVSPAAMARSLAQTAYEFKRLSHGHGNGHGHGSDASLREALRNPEVEAVLGRFRNILRERSEAESPVSVLLVFQDLEPRVETLAAVDLANALASRHVVFVWVARPHRSDPSVTSLLDDRVLFLEGSPGVPPWPLPEPRATRRAAARFREEVLGDLIALHAIDVIDSRSESTDQLARRLHESLGIPCFHSAGAARGEALHRDGRQASSETPKGRQGICGFHTETMRRYLNQESLKSGGFRVFVATTTAEGSSKTAIRDARMVSRVLHRLPESARRGARVEFVTRERPLRDWQDRWGLDLSLPQTKRRGGNPLEVLAGCDVLLAIEPFSSALRAAIIAALALRIPVISADDPDARSLLVDGRTEAGVLIARNARGGLDLDRVAAAVLRYINEPDALSLHKSAADEIFRTRFEIKQVARRASAAYTEAHGPHARWRMHAGSKPADRPGSSLRPA